MTSRKQPHGKTIEGGSFKGIQKLIKNLSQKNQRNECLMSVFTSELC